MLVSIWYIFVFQGVYQLTWIERKLAATLFATPPSATIEDALESFLKAEDIQSGFYKANQFYIAKVSNMFSL